MVTSPERSRRETFLCFDASLTFSELPGSSPIPSDGDVFGTLSRRETFTFRRQCNLFGTVGALATS